MIRMQIQLEPATRDALRRRAYEEGKSMAAVAREILVEALAKNPKATGDPPPGARALFPFIGIIKDDPENVSENHDDYLYGDEDP